MAIYQLRKEQKIQAPIEEIWDFISSPRNLQKITPEYMGFDITTPDLPEKMYPGMIIAYKVSPLLGIKMTWVTEITHVEPMQFFVDEQRVGPYSMWHHEHHLIQEDDGVLMKDIVTYQPPMGILGAIANSLVIANQLEEIFEYRRIVMEKLFNSKVASTPA